MLMQVRVLYSADPRREQLVKALFAQWPATHYETYKGAYAGLVAKQLIRHSNAQSFSITDLGLKAMGYSPAASAAPVPAKRPNSAPETSPVPLA